MMKKDVGEPTDGLPSLEYGEHATSRYIALIVPESMKHVMLNSQLNVVMLLITMPLTFRGQVTYMYTSWTRYKHKHMLLHLA